MNEIKSKKTGLGYKLYRSRKAYVMLIPIIVCLGLFSYYPPIQGIINSFYQYDIGGVHKFVGFDNFAELFQDSVFLDSIGTMFLLTFVRLIINMLVPFIVAELLLGVKSEKLSYAYRVLFVLPVIAPGIVITFVWRYIYEPVDGALVQIIKALGMTGLFSTEGVDPNIIDWLGRSDLVLSSIIFMGFPWVGGTSVLIYLSGLLSVNSSVRESARLDGCGVLRKIWVIDLPAIMGQIKYFLVTNIVALLQDYNAQLLLTQGGPGYKTMVPAWWMYTQAFTYGRMGYACAIGTVMFALIFLISIFIRRFLKSEVE